MVQLSAQEHTLWQHLSVFAGSFTRDAVRAVVIGGQLPSTDADHLLDALVAHGYVVVEQSDVGLRYALPEPLRATARAQLLTQVEDTVYERLLTFYTAFAEEVEAHAFGSERAVWMRRLGAEHANLAAILTWLVARGNAEEGLHFAFTLREL